VTVLVVVPDTLTVKKVEQEAVVVAHDEAELVEVLGSSETLSFGSGSVTGGVGLKYLLALLHYNCTVSSCAIKEENQGLKTVGFLNVATVTRRERD
jgi:hypothetical protein